MDKVFYVDHVSNASMDVHPENTLSAFTNIMSLPIELEEPYEVSLNEIIYPLDFSQMVEVKYSLISVTKPPKVQKVFEGGGAIFKYDGSSKLKEIIDSFAKHVGDFLSGSKFFTPVAGKTGGQVVPASVKIKPAVGYDQDKERVYFVNGELSDGKKISIYFGDDSFLAPLGFDKKTFNNFFTHAKGGDILYAEYPPYLTSRSNLLFINTDIIEGHRVGDTMGRSLRTIPLSRGIYESVQYMSFPNEYFFPLRFSRIDRISIRITDENGENIRFRGGRVFITLKFRPRLYKSEG